MRPSVLELVKEIEDFLERHHALPHFGNAQPKLEKSWEPKVDVHENDCGYILSVKLPQVGKHDVVIDFEDDSLTIHGERHCHTPKGVNN